MSKTSSLRGKTGILILLVLIAFLVLSVQGREPSSPAVTSADVIVIDGLKDFGALERPAVMFPHARHVAALAKDNDACATCHLRRETKLMPKFKRLADTGFKTGMDLYHRECIDCHKSVKTGKTGPLLCGGCHRGSPDIAVSRMPMELDKSLHYRHVKALDEKCETCHHEYDREAKTLTYVKGRESSCRYCHKTQDEDNRISMSHAAHIGCVNCHLEKQAQKIATGPVGCDGCHDPTVRKRIETLKNIPRLKRGQPDMALILTGDPKTDDDGQPLGRMSMIPFKHKAHETYTDTCRVCHHAELSTCGKCHQMLATKDGGGLNAEHAMHMIGTQTSCRGCHEKQQNARECAGCHSIMRKDRPAEKSTCYVCHTPPMTFHGLDAYPKEKHEDLKARLLMASRLSIKNSFNPTEMPEETVIDSLTDQYEPVTFPHRKMVETMVNDIQNDNLGQFFHAAPGTVCLSCHHNTPSTRNPSKCSNCHTKAVDGTKPMQPSLKAAFHQQCMGCHKQMQIVKAMECTSCHAQKTNH